MTRKEKLLLKNLHEFNFVTYKELERLRNQKRKEAEDKYKDMIVEQEMLINKLLVELEEIKTAYEISQHNLSISLSTVYSPKE